MIEKAKILIRPLSYSGKRIVVVKKMLDNNTIEIHGRKIYDLVLGSPLEIISNSLSGLEKMAEDLINQITPHPEYIFLDPNAVKEVVLEYAGQKRLKATVVPIYLR